MHETIEGREGCSSRSGSVVLMSTTLAVARSLYADMTIRDVNNLEKVVQMVVSETPSP